AFLPVVVVLSLTTFTATADAAAPSRPRMLVAEADSWSSLAALKARYAAGARPPGDPPGWARSDLPPGDEPLRRKALAELPSTEPRRLKGSNLYMLYLARALAFDWLYGCSAFDAALREKVARELVDGAQKMLARPSLADPRQASYHNHTVRELAL